MTPRARAAAAPDDAGEQLGDVFEAATTEADAVVYLYRLKPLLENESGAAYLEKFDGGTSIDMEDVRRRWGGGTFRAILKARANDGSGPRALKKTSTFTIAGAPKLIGAGGAAPGEAQPNGAGVTVHQIAGEVAKILRGGSGAGDGSAIDEDEREHRRWLRRTLTEVSLLRNAGQEAEAGSGMVAMFERLLDVLDRVQDRERDREPSMTDNLAAIALRLLETPRSELPQTIATAPAAPVPAKGPTPMERQQQFLDRIAEAAQADEDPDALAQWALALLPANFKAQLPQLDAARFLALFASFPVAAFQDAAVQEWLVRFREALLARLPSAPTAAAAAGSARGPGAKPQPQQQQPPPPSED